MLAQNRSGRRLLEYISIPEQDLDHYDVSGSLVIVTVKQQYLIGFNSWRKQWEFPAGRRESGEHPRETAVRELFEETHQQNQDLSFLGIAKIQRPSSEIRYTAVFQCQQDELAPFIKTDEDEMEQLRLWDLKEPIGYFDECDLKIAELTLSK